MAIHKGSIGKSMKYKCGGKVKKYNKGGKAAMECCAAAYLHEKAKMYKGGK